MAADRYEPAPPGYKKIFCRYIVKNGVRIFPKRAKCFCFVIPIDGTVDDLIED